MFYIIMLTSLFLLLCLYNNEQLRIKKLIIVIVSISLILIIGLRNVNLGLSDTKDVYLPQFRRILTYNYSQVISEFKDPVFYVTTKLFTNIISKSFNFWLVVCAALYIIPIMKLIYKKSFSALLSVMMFISLNYFGMGFAGIRHCIAIGILCNSFDYLLNRNFKKFLLTVIIACCFHVSALIFLIAYPLCNKVTLSKKESFARNCIIILVIFVINNFFGVKLVSSIMNFIVNNLHMERFTIYSQEGFSSLSNTTFFINYFIFVLSGYIIYSSKNIIIEKSNERKINVLLSLQFIATILSSLVKVLGEFYRLSMFFSIFSIILLPETIKCFQNKKTRSVFILVLTVLFSLYFIMIGAKNNMITPYSFFWE